MRLNPSDIAHATSVGDSLVLITKDGRLLTLNPYSGLLVSATLLPAEDEIAKVHKEPVTERPKATPAHASTSSFTLG